MADTDDFAQSLQRMSWWGRMGYRSKRAEIVLYLAALTGLPLWSGFAEPWPLARWLLGGHVLVSLVLMPLILLPFWLSHRRHLAGSVSRFLRTTGQFIEIVLVVVVLSGLWLVVSGNRGPISGRVAYWAHLLAALPLIVLVLVHSWRYALARRLFALAALVAAIAALVTAPSWAAQPVAPAVSSGSFVLAEDGRALYSANFQAGSVARIDKADGRRTALSVLGGDIERVAVAEQQKLVAATDPVAGKLHLLRLGTLERVRTIDLPGRPMGVVADSRNNLFWVALFEGRRLLGVDASGKTRVSLAVPETPRGLALLGDGRLLITHAMIGQVSVVDTTVAPPVIVRTITLAQAEDPTETVSQGLPRLLDQIAVSPDQTEAWLPHVLWNFDHPFQFQSTVFPAVSLLALTPGAEHEAVEHRKQLFKQINILEDGNRTRIVSNPDSAAFSEDGGKVYVTASASEDLIVFDRSRSGGLAQTERRARRNNKLDQGGAKAVQIFRHLPGDNPRGVVVSGDAIYVQNAMSLDVSRLDNGAHASANEDEENESGGAFATVSIAQPQFARLVDTDPVAPKLRRGLRLFFNGNTDDFADMPMAGDNWMSCQSCHVDGFNFTNGYLFRDTRQDKAVNAVPGHAGLKTMVAGDFVGDYLRMIRDTQGGGGADTRFPTPNTDPDGPSPTAQAMMADLHAYVTAPENLPFLSTWVRLDDPRGTTHPKEWLNSASCAECHTEMFEQWADSLHRLMANGNPYYRVVEDVAAKTEGESFRMWCLGCHQPQGVMSGLTRTDGPSTLLEKGAASLIEAHEKGEPVQEEGTGCLLCHRITRIEDAGLAGGANTSFTVNLKDRQTYVFEDAGDGLAGWLGRTQINAKPDIHARSYSQPFYKDPKLCATCHGEFAPGTGAVIVNTYGEWEASPYNRPDDPALNRTCIDCHMHGDIARIGQDVPGRSTNGGKVKANVVTHQFTGANHHLVGLRNQKLADMSIQLLRGAARLSVQPAAAGQVNVRVANVGAGHSLPTGVADFREMWLDVTVTDARGQQVLRSGALAADGSLPEQGTRMFRKVFGDRDGKPVGLRFWRHEKMLEQTMIPAGGHRDEVYDLAPGAVYPVKVEARLMFRIYPTWVTDAVRQQFPELPPPQPVEMTSLNQVVEIAQP